MLSKRALAISPSLTLGISAKVKQLRAEGRNIINLSIGEPDFPTPDCAKVGGLKAIENNLTKYDVASGNLELKKAICQKLLEENNLQYAPEDIVVSSGAKHSISNALMALIDPGDEVLVPVPYWVSYPEMVELLGGKAVMVPTKKENGFKLTLEEVQAAVTPKTKVIILNNPSNPTGNVYTKEDLMQICPWIVEQGITIIADEIYERIVYDVDFVSIASLSDAIKARTVVINGLSKSASMTGWRIGYTASDTKLAKAMGSIQSHLVSHPSTISMQAALFALRDCKVEIKAMRDTYQERRDLIQNYLAKELPELSFISPLGAFYVFIDVGSLRDKLEGDSLSIKVCEDMLDRGVAFVPGIGFGEDHFIRMSYAASLDNIQEGLKRLKEYVKSCA